MGTRLAAVGVIALALCSVPIGCTRPTGGRALFDEAVTVLSTQPLGHEAVDWARLRREMRPTIPAEAPAADAHDAIRAAVNSLNNPHAQFIPPAPPHVPAVPAQAELADGQAAPAPTARRVPTAPECAMRGEFAYLILPACAAPDVAGLKAYAQSVRACIESLRTHSPRGWIIDLRLNAGGNCWPMLVGLQPLLGDGVMTTGLTGPGGGVRSRCGLSGNAAWLEIGGVQTEPLRLDGPLVPTDTQSPVAVLIGSWTMSSAELLALALRGRANTRLFGEPAAGLTTVNNYFPLSDGSILNLPIEVMGDRRGTPAHGPVAPDEHIEGGDWPTIDDPVAARAAAWISLPN